MSYCRIAYGVIQDYSMPELGLHRESSFGTLIEPVGFPVSLQIYLYFSHRWVRSVSVVVCLNFQILNFASQCWFSIWLSFWNQACSTAWPFYFSLKLRSKNKAYLSLYYVANPPNRLLQTLYNCLFYFQWVVTQTFAWCFLIREITVSKLQIYFAPMSHF